MAIDEAKLTDWINDKIAIAIRKSEIEQQVAETKPHPLLNALQEQNKGAINILQTLLLAIPELQEEPTVFADMEINQLFAEMEATINTLDNDIESFRNLSKAQAKIDAIASAALEKYQPL